MAATRRSFSASRSRGIALVLVLWITVLLTAIASSFAFSMRGEALAARNAVSLSQVRAAADGAVDRTVFELVRPKVLDVWQPDGAIHKWQDGEIELAVTATDESAKIDINTANELLLRGLFNVVGGVDVDTAAHLVDAVVDYRDADDLRRPNGAEGPDYQAAGLKYVPTNAPFETAGEISRVLGMTPEIYGRIASSITVLSRQPGVNPNTASREILLALPNATPEAVDAFIAARTDAMAARPRLPIPPFLPAQGLISGAIQTYRVRAQATLPDGVTFVREAVVRPSPDPMRPIIVLAWLEGAALPAPAPAAESRPESDGQRP